MKKIKVRLTGIYFYDALKRCYRKMSLKKFKLNEVRISKADYLKV